MTIAIFRDLESGSWAEINPNRCPCHGSGWVLSDYDSWHRCPIHGHSVPYPDEEDPSFDYSAHKLQMYKEAYKAFFKRCWMCNQSWTPERFRAQCVTRLMDWNWSKATPGDWVDAAEKVLQEIDVQVQRDQQFEANRSRKG